MSDYILLGEISFCPACRRKTVPEVLPGLCRACGMWLFKASDQIKKFEDETGWREYWVWTGKQKGWVHRSHLFDTDGRIVRDETALDRVYREPELPKDYGTPEYQKRRIKEVSPHSSFIRH